MPQIHPTAIIAPGATFAEDVAIGPYCVVGDEVVLGAGVKLMAHVVVDGHTTIGEQTRIFPFASIGLEPQDLKYGGEKSSLVIGRNNTIREHVTMNPAPPVAASSPGSATTACSWSAFTSPMIARSAIT
jgi:UDP-N-acetylglucosamine acyltransferase